MTNTIGSANPNPGHIRPILTPDTPLITYNGYSWWLQSIRQYNVEQRARLLVSSAQISNEVPVLSFYSNNVPIQAMATTIFALQQTLSNLVLNWGPPPTNFYCEYFEANKCINVATGVIKNQYFFAPIDTEEEHSEILLHLNWKLNSDSQYEGDAKHQIVNALVLSGLSAIGGLESDPALVNSLFENQLGITAYDFFKITFYIWSRAAIGKQLFINPNNFLNGLSKPRMKSIKLFKTLNDLSLSISDSLHSTQSDLSFAKTYSGQCLANAIFDRKPIIRFSNESYMNVGHPFLKVQMTHKFVQKADYFARILEKKGETRFGKFVSNRMEKYFEILCRNNLTATQQFNEYQYETGCDKKSADYILFDKSGTNEAVNLIQLKIKTLVSDVFYGSSQKELIAEISKHAKAIYQSINFLYQLNNARDKCRLNRVNESLSLRILNANKCNLIGITPIDPAIFVSTKMRRLLLESVESHLDPKVWQWFLNRYKSQATWQWHIMGLDHFQVFLSMPIQSRNFDLLLTNYLRESNIDNSLIDSSGDLVASFRDYLIQKHNLQNHFHPIQDLENTFNDFKISLLDL